MNNHEFIEECRDILGAANVLVDSEAYERYGRNTFGEHAKVNLALRPASTAEVQALIRLCSRAGVSVFPISRGRNWGYGDAVPPTVDQVVCDLSRMNRIVHVDEQFGYAVIEPGVSQRQLFDHLQAEKIDLWLDATGAGPDASIVGNILERGFGHTPLADKFLNSCNYEIVLPSGEVVNSGFNGDAPNKMNNLYKYGIGPSFDGLFVQSNFGIVTRMTVSLLPKPEAFTTFVLGYDSTDRLVSAIPDLRYLKGQNALPNALHIGNDLRVLSQKSHRPFSCEPERAYEERQRLAKRYGYKMWNALGALYGTNAQVRAMKKDIKSRLGRDAMVVFLSDRKLDLAESLLSLLPRIGPIGMLRDRIDSVRPVFDLLKGNPSEESLKGVYWRNHDVSVNQVKPNPNDPGVGLYWMSPMLPLTGEDCRVFNEVVDATMFKYGFDPLITLTVLNQKCLQGVISINFDKRDAAQVVAAKSCYEQLVEVMMARGYPPYRLGQSSYQYTTGLIGANAGMHAAIKRALDPQSIVAPGRYEPRQPELVQSDRARLITA